MKHVTLIVVLPVGPDDNGADTIDSIFLYLTPSVHIIAIDDSKNASTKTYLQTIDERVTVLEARGRGIRGGVWTSLAFAYQYALDHFNFDALLRMDTDALVVGAHPEDEAIEAFAQNPDLGMLGSYRVDCNGDKRNFKIAARGMRKEYGMRGFANRQRRSLLRSWIRAAKNRGYEPGEHILGAADFQSYKCIRSMSQKGYLDTMLLKDSGISEDHLFSLLTIACGYQLGDFATGSLPMGLRWRGLPDAPGHLIQRNKTIIHSVKSWDGMDEKAIRLFFAERRARAKKERLYRSHCSD